MLIVLSTFLKVIKNYITMLPMMKTNTKNPCFHIHSLIIKLFINENKCLLQVIDSFSTLFLSRVLKFDTFMYYSTKEFVWQVVF